MELSCEGKEELFLNLDNDVESQRALVLLFQIWETLAFILAKGKELVEREMWSQVLVLHPRKDRKGGKVGPINRKGAGFTFVLVSCDCHKLRCLTRQKIILSESWKQEDWSQGVGKAILLLKVLENNPSFSLSSFWWCWQFMPICYNLPPTFFPPCMSLWLCHD